MRVYTIQDCPFCGSDKVFVDFKDVWGVGCRTCHAFTTFEIVSASENFAAIIDAYNRRAKEGGGNGNK